MQPIFKKFVVTELATKMNKKSLFADTCLSSCSSCPSRKVCISQHIDEQSTSKVGRLIAETLRVSKNKTLYQKHDKQEALFLVRFGQFKLIGEDLYGEQRVAGFYMAGDVMGMDAIATGRHQYRVAALENSEVCEIPFGFEGNMLSDQPELQRRLFRAMSDSLNSHCCRATMLAKTPVDARFANFLLMLGKKYSTLGYSERSFRLAMSRSDIASYLGTSVETVSRLISRLNVHGAVNITGRLVAIDDQSYLQALVSGHGESMLQSVSPVSVQQDVL